MGGDPLAEAVARPTVPGHIMIDVETLGTRPGSALLSVGAVRFDPMGSGYSDTFYARVDIGSCFDVGMTVDAGTIEWWLHPDRSHARAELVFLGRPARPLLEMLRDLSAFVGPDARQIWAHGPSFDLILLEDAYRRHGMLARWKYSAHRDTRTIFEAAERIKPGWRDRSEPEHHALADAVAQAADVQRAHAILFPSLCGTAAPA